MNSSLNKKRAFGPFLLHHENTRLGIGVALSLWFHILVLVYIPSSGGLAYRLSSGHNNPKIFAATFRPAVTPYLPIEKENFKNRAPSTIQEDSKPPEAAMTHVPNAGVKTQPVMRIGPKIVLALEGQKDQTFKMLLQVNERGRVTDVSILTNTELEDGVLKRIKTAFRDEAVFVPSTLDGIPVRGTLILEVNLTDE